ncbi:MAG: hypothetical protein HQL48_11465 [Gammaproteobacteria bacterium]|nr:hypothetical protein [Gammaproteobacteria bacterium]
MTAFRYLRQLPYLHSYNHNGRYYCLYEPARHDRFGIWSVRNIHFSVDKTLGKTVRRLVCEAPTGITHGELQELLGVRVHNTLLARLRKGEIGRELYLRQYLYLHSDADVRQQQIQQRQAMTDAKDAEQRDNAPPTDDLIIAVLLTLLRHPEAKALEVVRYLQGHSPPISMAQCEAIFARYDLDPNGKKGGDTIS